MHNVNSFLLLPSLGFCDGPMLCTNVVGLLMGVPAIDIVYFSGKSTSRRSHMCKVCYPFLDTSCAMMLFHV